MTRVGMDAAAMRLLVDELRRTAADIEGGTHRVEMGVHHAVLEWFGEAGHHFVSEWNGRSKVALVTLGAELHRLANRAAAEIEAQEHASAATSGDPLARVAPTWALGNGRSATYGPKHELRITQQRTLDAKGPHNVSDLLNPLNGKDPSKGSVYAYPGGISVSVSGNVPDCHVIVTISGTENWWVGTTNPDDMGTNLQHLVGGHTPKELAIAEALQRSGVTSNDHVMLVGHSQGGADAMAFAKDNAHATNGFHVEGVVTVGAPTTPDDAPRGVDVLALRGTEDLVPLGGYNPGGLGPDAHTVEVPEPRMLPTTAHDPSTYQQHLPTDSAAVQGFQNRHADYFSGGPTTTTLYSNERVHASPALELAPLLLLRPPIGLVP